MVAGGGGGGHSYHNIVQYNSRTTFPITNGLALTYTGTNGQWSNSTYSTSVTQVSGGSFGSGTYYTSLDGSHGAGGGGGGYWGGRANTNGSGGPGTGGTSYVSGLTGAVAVASANTNSPRLGSEEATCVDGTTDITCSYHYSGLVFNNPEAIAGYSKMPSATGTEKMTGNEGNGRAKITVVENFSAKIASVNSGYEDLDSIFDRTITEYRVSLPASAVEFKLNATPVYASTTITGIFFFKRKCNTSFSIGD